MPKIALHLWRRVETVIKCDQPSNSRRGGGQFSPFHYCMTWETMNEVLHNTLWPLEQQVYKTFSRNFLRADLPSGVQPNFKGRMKKLCWFWWQTIDDTFPLVPFALSGNLIWSYSFRESPRMCFSNKKMATFRLILAENQTDPITSCKFKVGSQIWCFLSFCFQWYSCHLEIRRHRAATTEAKIH